MRYLVVGGARCLLGVVMATRSRPLLDRVEPGPAPRFTAGLTTVLGLRELVQGGLLAAVPRAGGKWPGRVVRASAAVDALHLTTMILAALPRSRYRRPAMVAAVEASADLLADLALAGR